MPKLTPVKYKNEILPGYYLDEDGNIYSDKSAGRKIERLSPWHNPDSEIKANHYPKVTLSVGTKRLSVKLHILVGYTLIPFYRPTEISASDWKKTPESVKQLLNSTYRIDHIDENKQNYHPSNLEWVTAKTNSERYVKNKYKFV